MNKLLIGVLSYSAPVALAAAIYGAHAWLERRAARRRSREPARWTKPPGELVFRRTRAGCTVWVWRDGSTLRIEVDSRGRIDARLVVRAETRFERLTDLDELTCGDRSFDDRFHLEGPEPILLGALSHAARAELTRAADSASVRVLGSTVLCETREARAGGPELERLLQSLTAAANQLACENGGWIAALERNATTDPLPEVRLRNLQAFTAEPASAHARARAAARKALDDPYPPVRLLAAHLERGTPKAFTTLVAIFADAKAQTAHRVAALRQLGGIYGSQAREFLTTALGTAEEPLIVEALQWVGALRESALAARAAELALAGSPAVAQGAAKALRELGDSAAEPTLIQLLKSESADVRREAAEALGKVGTARCVESLLPLTQAVLGSYEVKDAARNAIAEVQARLGDAGGGRLSLAPITQGAGGLSLAAESGSVSLTEAGDAGGGRKSR